MITEPKLKDDTAEATYRPEGDVDEAPPAYDFEEKSPLGRMPMPNGGFDDGLAGPSSSSSGAYADMPRPATNQTGPSGSSPMYSPPPVAAAASASATGSRRRANVDVCIRARAGVRVRIPVRVWRFRIRGQVDSERDVHREHVRGVFRAHVLQRDDHDDEHRVYRLPRRK